MIRDLFPAEFPDAAALAAAAFRDYPAYAHIVPDDAERRRRLPSLILAALRLDRALGAAIRGAFDGGALVGMSSTRPAGSPEPTRLGWLKASRGLWWMLGRPSAALRALAQAEAVGAVKVRGADYLHLLAVHPATQGRGIGAALINDALKSGRGLYLETFSPESAAWYDARGFERTAETRSPHRATFWTFRRAGGNK